MRLSDAVELRVAPTVHFAPDLSFDKADRIEKLLHDPSVIRDLKKNDPKDGNNGA